MEAACTASNSAHPARLSQLDRDIGDHDKPRTDLALVGWRLRGRALAVLQRMRPDQLNQRYAVCPLVIAMFAALTLIARPCSADIASWMYVGAGMSQVDRPNVSAERRSLMQLDAGFGSSPYATLVFGGILRTLTHFDGGTDLAIAQRTTTGGFSRGDWGLALDLGGYQRWWGRDSRGGMASAWLGAPWGLQLGITGEMGTGESRTIALTLGLDWARATAHRHPGQEWWRNYILPRHVERN